MVTCRACRSTDLQPILDLGTAPPSNAYLTAEQANGPEVWLPLRLNVCTSCWLMQTEDFVSGQDVFTADYAYFSSMSKSWVEHARTFVDSASADLSLDGDSFVIEVACNDGYLLQFVQERGIRCLGIEPTDSTASAAIARGLEVERDFLTEATADRIAGEHGKADLVVANNVVAHVPDIVDFVRGLATLLRPGGVLSLEFAYGVELVRHGQFDTVYHEHFSYLTLTSATAVLRQAGLQVINVEHLTTHGGSLRVWAQFQQGALMPSQAVTAVMNAEVSVGVRELSFYSGLQDTAVSAKNGLLNFLLQAREAGGGLAGYGAAAKGNTLLNFAGVRPDLLPYVVDKSPGKAGKLLPGSRIPVLSEASLEALRPNAFLVLPWNLQSEIMGQLQSQLSWEFAAWVAIPKIQRIGYAHSNRLGQP